ncbi:PTS transporter subunit EIIC [Enterococcus casseliflavus]|uniref:PTS transporter subunit EIIC n=1 Tax=Enterococcus casseliflavus TaxID=37734 RepID=UPI003D0DCDE2
MGKEKNTQYEDISQEIINGVGGSSNISTVTHCMTRLRFLLKDSSIPNDASVKNIKGVIGVNRSAGQYQIIIGQTVPKVYDSLCSILGIQKIEGIDENIDPNMLTEKITFKNVGSIILNKVAGSLTPIIPVLVVSGMFKMLATVLGPLLLGILSDSSSIYQLFNFVGDAGFYFLPVILGYTSAKQFRVTPVLGILMGAILIHPTLINIVTEGKAFDIFGIPMQLVNYSSSVIPILLSMWILGYVENFFKQYVPSSLSTIFVPTLSILVMLPIALCILGPLGGWIGDLVGLGFNAANSQGGIISILAIALIGAFWSFMVMTGMHLVLITTMMVVYTQVGYENFVSPGAIAATLAVSGMCLGAALRSKNKEDRSLALGFFVAAFVGGVTEPALYGLAVPNKRPFIGLAIGGFIGGLYAGITHTTSYIVGSPSNFLYFTGFVGADISNVINAILTGVIALVSAAVATYIIGVDNADTKKIEEDIILKPVEV